MVDSYIDFARFYDSLMEDARYPERADYLLEICACFSHPVGDCLDLACGTGSLTGELYRRGVNVTGAPEGLDPNVPVDSAGVLDVGSSIAGFGSPSPACGKLSGLKAGEVVMLAPPVKEDKTDSGDSKADGANGGQKKKDAQPAPPAKDARARPNDRSPRKAPDGRHDHR